MKQPKSKFKLYSIVLFLIVFSISTTSFAQNIELLHNKADTLHDAENYDKARDVYNQIIKLDSKNAKAYNRTGNCYLAQEKFDSARINYETAILIDSKYSSPYYNLGLIYYYQQENALLAISKIKEALKIAPDSASYCSFMGICFNSLSENDSALFYYEKAIEIDPNYTESYYYKATLLLEIEQPELALQSLEEGIKRNAKEYYFFLLKAKIEADLEKYDLALQDCNIAIEKEPEYLPAYEMRAEYYFMLDKTKECIDECKYILQKTPDNAGILYLISWTYLQIEDYEQTKVYAKKGVEVNPYHDLLQKILGFAYFYSLDFENAIIYFDKAIELNPTDVQNFDYKAQAILFSKNSNELLNDDMLFLNINLSNLEHIKKQINDKKSNYYFKNLLKKFENDKTSLSIDEFFMLYYGQSLQKKFSGYSTNNTDYKKKFAIGDYDKCIEVAEKELSVNPFLIEAYLYIAYSYLYLSNYTKAIEYLVPYHGFLAGISSTGDGLSFETPYLITSITDEYNMMYYLGLTNTGQSLYNENGHSFDVITGEDSVGNEVSIHFCIDSFFGTPK